MVRSFPLLGDEGGRDINLPEAWPGLAHLFPYKRDDLSRRYPMAKVDFDPGGEDPPGDYTVEEYGVKLASVAGPQLAACRRRVVGSCSEKNQCSDAGTGFKLQTRMTVTDGRRGCFVQPDRPRAQLQPRRIHEQRRWHAGARRHCGECPPKVLSVPCFGWVWLACSFASGTCGSRSDCAGRHRPRWSAMVLGLSGHVIKLTITNCFGSRYRPWHSRSLSK